jgi:hypothetical protein
VVDRTLELYEAWAFGDRPAEVSSQVRGAAQALEAPDLTVHH